MSKKNEIEHEVGSAFDSTYNFLREYYEELGLTLTPIEAVKLREIIKCKKQRKIERDSGNVMGFELSGEVQLRFFREVFGVDLESYMAHFTDNEDVEQRMKELMSLIKTKIRGEIDMI